MIDSWYAGKWELWPTEKCLFFIHSCYYLGQNGKRPNDSLAGEFVRSLIFPVTARHMSMLSLVL